MIAISLLWLLLATIAFFFVNATPLALFRLEFFIIIAAAFLLSDVPAIYLPGIIIICTRRRDLAETNSKVPGTRTCKVGLYT